MVPAYLLTIGLITSILLMLVIMLVLLLSYHDMVKKFRYSQRENTFLKNHQHEKSMEVLDTARTKALALLEEAEQKATEIIRSANTYEDQATAMMEKTLVETQGHETQVLKQTTDTVLKSYAADLQTTEQANLKTLQSLTQAFEQEAQKELQQVSLVLSKDAAMSEKVLAEHMTSTQDTAEKEIALYKQQRLAKVDERILELLNTVAQDVFRKSLSLEEHQQIVIDALETAKQDLLKN